ncbi:D-galactose-binding periplasmic protein precursor [Clostridium puniceum]|uniref:D-galactose/methyl-galactoside binding periplasmic protein MglB n=1 Tax=Clostridium puniceum TaxID=29367 RepID=A0A1S8TY35_9CLOT|nr:galactose ABC transporter substrate-binding protein [Clostridium puniceum]OOM82624.1 D-galactose-binding periplasmic protein precursor [Clostridium puniceum]
MKILKKILMTLFITTTIVNVNANDIYTYAQNSPQKTINSAVLLFTFDDPYISLVRKDLEEIQNKNGNNVTFTFYNGKRNQDIQNELIDSVIQNNYNLLLVNLVNLDQDTVKSVVDKVKEKNIPVIFFNVVPFQTEAIKSYNKALVISTDANQSGVLQGNLVVNEWNTNKNNMDKNKDNILQYFMLKGPANNTETDARSLYSISTINNAGIKTQEILSKFCYWDEKCAQDSTELLFLRYGDKIEAIIANNDAMAIGAIKALQKYDYNKGDKYKYIPVFGIDGIQEARNLINNGSMAGTVFQNPKETADALYTIGMNLVNNLNPLENTNYKFDETGVTINTPYHEYIPEKQ